MKRQYRVARLSLVLFFLPMLLPVWPSATTLPSGNSSQSSQVLLREGTEVKLKLQDKVSSKRAVEGDLVHLTLDQDLKVGDFVVAKAGAAAFGTISRATRSGSLGRPGDLAIRLEYLQVGGSRVALRGSRGNQGKGKEGTAVVLTILLGPLDLLSTAETRNSTTGHR